MNACMLEGENTQSTLCNPCPYEYDCKTCKEEMEAWYDPWQIPAELYWKWMKSRKCRRKARYYRKLKRIEDRCIKLR